MSSSLSKLLLPGNSSLNVLKGVIPTISTNVSTFTELASSILVIITAFV